MGCLLYQSLSPGVILFIIRFSSSETFIHIILRWYSDLINYWLSLFIPKTLIFRERTSSSHLNLNQSWFEELSVLLCCFEVFLITFDCCAFLTRELDCSDGFRSPLKGRIVSWNWLQSTYICLNVKMLKTNFTNLPALGEKFLILKIRNWHSKMFVQLFSLLWIF